MFHRSRPSENVIGFALSGGGSRAASQIGALRALEEMGILPNMVAGTSAGAVNATWQALYPGRLDGLEAIWMALRTQDVFPGGRFRILLNLARSGYVHRADRWEAFLRGQMGEARFEDAQVPCMVVAVRLRDGARVVFDSGEILPALMASTAIPGVFPPYRIGDDLYVDGGLIEYLPLPALFERGATTVYALDCSHYSVEEHDVASVVDRCGRIAARASVELMTSVYTAQGKTVHLLQPELPEFDDARNFGFTAHMVDVGYRQASEYLRSHESTTSRPVLRTARGAG